MNLANGIGNAAPDSNAPQRVPGLEPVGKYVDYAMMPKFRREILGTLHMDTEEDVRNFYETTRMRGAQMNPRYTDRRVAHLCQWLCDLDARVKKAPSRPHHPAARRPGFRQKSMIALVLLLLYGAGRGSAAAWISGREDLTAVGYFVPDAKAEALRPAAEEEVREEGKKGGGETGGDRSTEE